MTFKAGSNASALNTLATLEPIVEKKVLIASQIPVRTALTLLKNALNPSPTALIALLAFSPITERPLSLSIIFERRPSDSSAPG